MFKTAATAALILAATTVGMHAQGVITPGKYFTAQTFQALTDPEGLCGVGGVTLGATNYGVITIGAQVSGASPATQLVAQQIAATTSAPAGLNPVTCVLAGYPTLSLTAATTTTGGAACSTLTGLDYSLYSIDAVNPGAGAPADTLVPVSVNTTTGAVSSYLSQNNVYVALAAAVSASNPLGTICALSVEAVSTYTGQ